MSEGDLGQLLDESVKKMKTLFADYISRLSTIFFSAKRLGIVDKAKAAIILFKPDQLNKIERQLDCDHPTYKIFKAMQPLIADTYFESVNSKIRRYRSDPDREFIVDMFGRDAINESYDVIDMLDVRNRPSNFFRNDNISSLAEALNDSESRVGLDDSDKLAIKDGLKNFDWDAFSDLLDSDRDLKQVDGLQNWYQNLKRISDYFEIPELMDMGEFLVGTFVIREYNQAIKKDDFSTIEDIYSRWQGDKTPLDTTLIAVYHDLLLRDYRAELGKKYDANTIKESEFWKLLQKFGLDRKV
jgi:hypothetical protein